MMKLAIVVCAILSGCAGYMGGTNVSITNGCKLDATARMSAIKSGKYLKDSGVEYARILDVFGGKFGDGITLPGHTYLIYMSPPGMNRLWSWDASGSMRLHAWSQNANSCAIELGASWGMWADEE